jgi:glycopeptide antibiotics resistance protein
MISTLFSIPQWLRIMLSLLYLTIIVFLSLLPPNDFPEIPLFTGADKIVHTCMYFGLTWLACWSMHAEFKRKWYFLIILFSISWGTIMEIFQFLMHIGRSFDVFDIIGNSIGTLIGVLIYILMAKQKRKIDLRKVHTP